MKNIFDAAFDRSLKKTRKENEKDPVVGYNRKALILAVAGVAVGCAATVVLAAVSKANAEGLLDMSE